MTPSSRSGSSAHPDLGIKARASSDGSPRNKRRALVLRQRQFRIASQFSHQKRTTTPFSAGLDFRSPPAGDTAPLNITSAYNLAVLVRPLEDRHGFVVQSWFSPQPGHTRLSSSKRTFTHLPTTYCSCRKKAGAFAPRPRVTSKRNVVVHVGCDRSVGLGRRVLRRSPEHCEATAYLPSRSPCSCAGSRSASAARPGTRWVPDAPSGR